MRIEYQGEVWRRIATTESLAHMESQSGAIWTGPNPGTIEERASKALQMTLDCTKALDPSNFPADLMDTIISFDPMGSIPELLGSVTGRLQ